MTYQEPAQGLKGLDSSSAKSCTTAQPRMRVLPGYFEQGSHWVEVGQGRVPISQLDGGDAERPDVTAGIVGGVQLLLAGYYLWAEGGVAKDNWTTEIIILINRLMSFAIIKQTTHHAACNLPFIPSSHNQVGTCGAR